MTTVPEARSESPWATLGLLALGFILMVLLLASPVLIRALLFQPFNIPANSMVPTLQVGDFFFVSKYAYGYSRYTWPFSAEPFEGRIWGSEPARGDVVAFLSTKDNATVFIKRVVGLPGDRVQMKQGFSTAFRLRVSGWPILSVKGPVEQGLRPG